MTSKTEVNLDFDRSSRIGMDEAIFCQGKTKEHLREILTQAGAEERNFLLTRLSPEKHSWLRDSENFTLDYDPVSETAFFGEIYKRKSDKRVAVVSAGTSDSRTAKEVTRTLYYFGHNALEVADVGVAGLWRLLDRLDELRSVDVVVAVAGMDAALPTVLGGLIAQPLIGVPTSVGYGVAQGGLAALQSMLVSCSPGITVTNIDNGYGGACAALRILRSTQAS